jgi:ABC transport system ATP-binding/permease protein
MATANGAALNLLSAEGISKSYDHRLLFSDLTIGISKGERIGIVGVNGGGKSTLIKVLAGIEPSDSGRIAVNSECQLGFLYQTDPVDPDTLVFTYLFSNTDRESWERNGEFREIIFGLLGEEAPKYFDRKMNELSGGESRRIHLAKLLMAKSDLLFLDEPTNHLDLLAIKWLANYLKEAKDLTLVTVTHDRWFLDEVANYIWEVVDGEISKYEGGYSAFILSKAERQQTADILARKRNALIKKELAWLRRGAPARTSKPKFRVEVANELIAKEPPIRNDRELLNFAANKLGKRVVELHNATFEIATYDQGNKKIINELNWNLIPGDRIGILGPNGAGKTTLLSLFAGELSFTSGECIRGQKLVTAYLSQHLAELEATDRVIESVKEIANSIELANGEELGAAQLCERLGFDTDGQWRKIGSLSGGERRRLQLTRLLMTSPNFLLLDEPTNDFDIETLTALEDLLDNFAGTIICVSHDRFFLERVCNDFYYLSGDGSVRHLPRGIDEFLEITLLPETQVKPLKTKGVSSAAQIRSLKKDLSRLENSLEKARTEVDQLKKAEQENSSNHEVLIAISSDLTLAEKKVNELEEEWLKLTLTIEELSTAS